MINFAQVGNDLYTGKRSIDFIKRQKTWYALSAVLIALALVGIFVKGLNFGIEFSGGSEFRVQGVSNSQGYEEKAQSAIATARHPGQRRLDDHRRRHRPRAVRGGVGRHRRGQARARPAAFGVDESAVSASLIGPSWGAVGQPAGDPGPHRLPRPRDDRHGALLPHLEDGRRRPGRAAARPRHHRRHLRAVRVRDHAVVDDRLPHDPRVLALRHGRRLRQGPREHRRGVPHQADDLLRRRPTSRSTRPWSGRSTRRSSRCCRSPRSSSSASPCSARARCSTCRSPSSSASRSAPTRRSSSPRRCSSTCAQRAGGPGARQARRAPRRREGADGAATAPPIGRSGADATGAAGDRSTRPTADGTPRPVHKYAAARAAQPAQRAPKSRR